MKKVTISTVTLVLIVLTAFIIYIIKDEKIGASEWAEERVEGTGQNKIIQLFIEGQILPGRTTEQVLSQLNSVLKDSSVLGIVLHINSPGGDVVASDDIYNKLLEVKKSGRRVVVSMGSIAASGGYYIAAAGDQIFANPSTVTGSIGVIISFTNYNGLVEKLGVSSINIASGMNKVLNDPFLEFSKEAEEIYRNVVEDSFEQFIKVVSEGRSMSTEEIKQIADGRIFSGKQAKELRLIDQYGNLEDATAYLKEQLNEPSIQVIRYSENSSMLNILLSKSTLQDEVSSLKDELVNSYPKVMYRLK